MPLLRPAIDFNEYVTMPEGRYFSNNAWLSFAVRGGPTCMVMWGRPSVDDIVQAIAIIEPDNTPHVQRRARYLDVRKLLGAEEAVYMRIVGFGLTHGPRLAHIVERLAVVHDGGMSFALAAGLPNLAPQSYAIRMFTEPADALGWLGVRSAASLAAEVDHLQARAVGTTPLLRDLRAVLAASLHDAALASAAKAIGCSERSLQRKLREQHTSFQRELDRCRIDAAKQLLAESPAPIATIARNVGFASTKHFAVLFRKLTDHTPRQWRTSQARKQSRGG